MIDGDAILYICGTYLKEQGRLTNNTVVTTVMSNLGLYKAFDAAGINYEKTAVGDKYVYECFSYGTAFMNVGHGKTSFTLSGFVLP